MLHSSLLFDIPFFFLILSDPVQLQAVKLWLLPSAALPNPRFVKKNIERFSAADIQNSLIKVYEVR
jgi:hypothetical protein